MKVYGLYSIYDKVAEEFGPIFESSNDMTATRAKNHLIKDVEEIMRDDYELYKVATVEVEKLDIKVISCSPVLI